MHDLRILSRIVFSTLLLCWTSCGTDPLGATCPSKPAVTSNLKATFCVDQVGPDGILVNDQRNAYSYGYGGFQTTATLLSTSVTAGASCKGRSFDFSTTSTTRIRVTVDLSDAGKSILPRLDLAADDKVTISAFRPKWTPATIFLSDDAGTVFEVSDEIYSQGSQNWLQVSRGSLLDTYCVRCGKYGVYALVFRTRDDQTPQVLRPGQTGVIRYNGNSYGIANVIAVRDIQVACSDVYGAIVWAAWRLPQ